MTLIPDLERQLTDAASRRSGRRRRVTRTVAAGAAAAALLAALFAVTIAEPDDSPEPRGGRQPAGGPLGLDIPQGHRPGLSDLIAAFRRERTPRDDHGFTKADLDEIPDRRPGEDPTRSRRVDLPTGPAYLWPMTDGVCSSFGGCIGIQSLLDVGGVAIGTHYSSAIDGRPAKWEVNGVVVDGIREIRLTRPGAHELVVPVTDNAFRIDVSRIRPLPTGAYWRDAARKEHQIQYELFPTHG